MMQPDLAQSAATTDQPLQLRFGADGLLPVIAQDCDSGAVLMLAYMNAESLRRTVETGEAWFWSRSRQQLWHKGATSGNKLTVVGIKPDCDSDTLLLSVRPAGPACHTGAQTCFFADSIVMSTVAQRADGLDQQSADALKSARLAVSIHATDHATDHVTDHVTDSSSGTEASAFGPCLEQLLNVIRRTRVEPRAGSYTTYLFDKGLDKILKKLGEECAETIIAAKNNDNAELVRETSDLLYHLLVLLATQGVTLAEIAGELNARKR